MMNRWHLILVGCVLATGLLRFMYCRQMPLSGDECITVLQSTGKAHVYAEHIPQTPQRVEEVNWLIENTGDFGCSDVLVSMKKAGVHPPFYYLLMHGVLGWFGNETIVLRLTSVLFSTLSIVLLYAVAVGFLPRPTAVAAAVLLGICAYGIHYAHMVRPYPLLMLLSLLSAWLAIRLSRRPSLSFSDGWLWAFMATVAAGLFTVYHFLFVFVFDMVILALAFRKSKRNLVVLILLSVMIGALYSVWIPSFLYQIDVINSGTSYFHGVSNPISLYRYFLETNFTAALPGTYSWYKFVLAGAVTAVMGLGLVWTLTRPTGRYLAAGLAGYLVLNLAADWIMKSQTLNVAKLMFFIVPMMVLYLAAGLSLLIRRRPVWGGAALAVVAAVLLYNSFVILQNPRAEDDPRHIVQYRSVIAETVSPDTPALVVVNETSRRYLLPLSHAIDFPGTWYLACEDVPAAMQGLSQTDFSTIYLLSPRFDHTFTPQLKEDFRVILEGKGYVPQSPVNIPPSLQDTRILVFQKQSL